MKRVPLDVLAFGCLAACWAGCGSSGSDGCNSHNECGAGQICVNGACQVVEQRVCSSRADCEANETCRDGVCEVQRCVATYQCDGSDLVCRNGVCVVDEAGRECDQTRPCPQGQQCNLYTFECEAAGCDCQPESPCTATDPACEQQGCVQLGCPTGFACNLQTGLCEETQPGCTVDTECDPGKACLDGECVPGCRSDADCQDPGYVCNQSTKQCECQAGPGQCEGCSTHAECAADEYCDVDGTCTKGCWSDTGCPNGQTCDTSKHQCTGGLVLCSSDSDCSAGQVCALEVSESGDALLTVCVVASGKLGGEDCASSDECATGYCLDQAVCFEACSQTADCSSGMSCNDMLFTLGTVKGCDPPMVSCTRDADCKSVQACLPFVENPGDTTLVYQCGLAYGTGGPGEACSSDDECASGICLTSGGAPAYCYGICSSDSDCPTAMRCYPDIITFTFDLETSDPSDDQYDSTPACVEDYGSYTQCQTDSDCPGEVCYPVPTGDLLAWDFRCLEADGILGAGDTCTADSDCMSGFCYAGDVEPSPSNPGACFGVCQTSMDCGGLTECTLVDIATTDRGTPDDDADDLVDSMSICL